MMLFNKRIITFIFSLWTVFYPVSLFAGQYSVNDCKSFELANDQAGEKAEYADALLWEIRKGNNQPSYLFGTMHISDPEILNFPDQVKNKLDSTDIFVMEALPLPEETLQLSQMMFFNDGQSLTNHLDESLFKKAVDILGNYNMPIEAVTLMKPWAAFLIMNYPPGDGLPMDLHLLYRAQENGAEFHGLETLTEQGNLFSNMSIDDQLQLLLDTLCNYKLISEDFSVMKSLYMQRDLQGLIDNNNKYSPSDKKLYEDLMKKLLPDRNYIMVNRMESFLKKGNAFIAIGALHLPGRDGVLSLLDKKGYKIIKIY